MVNILLPEPVESFASNIVESSLEPGRISPWFDSNGSDSSDTQVTESDSDDPNYEPDYEPLLSDHGSISPGSSEDSMMLIAIH